MLTCGLLKVVFYLRYLCSLMSICSDIYEMEHGTSMFLSLYAAFSAWQNCWLLVVSHQVNMPAKPVLLTRSPRSRRGIGVQRKLLGHRKNNKFHGSTCFFSSLEQFFWNCRYFGSPILDHHAAAALCWGDLCVTGCCTSGVPSGEELSSSFAACGCCLHAVPICGQRGGGGEGIAKPMASNYVRLLG